MAQWRWQFSGLTHATKVEDLEATLGIAVMAYRAENPPLLREKKADAVRKLAARLLTARLKFLKARLAATQSSTTAPEKSYQSLQQREAMVRIAGVQGILAEFGVPDAIE